MGGIPALFAGSCDSISDRRDQFQHPRQTAYVRTDHTVRRGKTEKRTGGFRSFISDHFNPPNLSASRDRARRATMKEREYQTCGLGVALLE
jgi:hypothetical protein